MSKLYLNTMLIDLKMTFVQRLIVSTVVFLLLYTKWLKIDIIAYNGIYNGKDYGWQSWSE